MILRALASLLLLSLASASPALAQAPAIPHGSLHHETYTVKYVKGLPSDKGTFVVYTPPNYDPARKPGYSVLYLLHGWGGNEDAWIRRGHADQLLDQMIAKGSAKPMIVVMPLGYGDMTFLTNGFEVWRDQDQISNNVNLFGQELIDQIMPQVDKTYDVATDRDHRAIAGLSMGGLESLTIGLRNPELFAWIGGFSSAIFPSPVRTSPNSTPRRKTSNSSGSPAAPTTISSRSTASSRCTCARKASPSPPSRRPAITHGPSGATTSTTSSHSSSSRSSVTASVA